MPTHYRATFTNGFVKELKASKRAYTHAWQNCWLNWQGKPDSQVGFASSYAKAITAARAARINGIPTQAEIVEVETLTR